jgi:sugar transferase (PEP-CTERM/EpsH1 system associated)
MRILFLSQRVPYPPDRGDRIRSWQILKYLSDRADVDLACTADEPVTTGTYSVLAKRCRNICISDVSSFRHVRALWGLLRGRSASEGVCADRTLSRRIAEWHRQRQYDAVFVYCSSMAPYLEAIEIEPRRVMVDLVDVDSRKWRQYAEAGTGPKRFIYGLESRRVARLERRAAERAGRLLVTTEDEARSAAEVCPGSDVTVMANGVDADYFGRYADRPPAADPTCIFTGVLDYFPNVDGIRWFAGEIWPQVRREFPTARLLVVGRRPRPEVLELDRLPGVEIRGDVPDVRPHLAEAHAAVVPLRIARGIQNKVLEAMAAGRTVVASAAALNGIEVEGRQEVLQADEPQEWVAGLRSLFTEESRRRDLGLAGQAYVRRHRVWDAQLSPLGDWLPELTAGDPPSGPNLAALPSPVEV